MATKAKTQGKAPEAQTQEQSADAEEDQHNSELEKQQSDQAVADTKALTKEEAKDDPTPEPAKEPHQETAEEMEARIRKEVLEELRQEDAAKDEERLRQKLLHELREQKVEEEREKKENEVRILQLALDDPEDDFFKGKIPIVVETKNIHDGEGRKYVGVTRQSNGLPAFAAPVHFMTESFAKQCLDMRVAREAGMNDVEDRLELILAQDEEGK